MSLLHEMDDRQRHARQTARRGVEELARPGGDVDIAITTLLAALGMLDETDRAARGAVLFNLGIAYRRAGDTEQAIARFEAALALRDVVVGPQAWADVANALGVAYQEWTGGERLLNLDRAIELLERARDLRVDADPADLASTLSNLANA
jgi:tetratricopeptide (TPR) repeat protein